MDYIHQTPNPQPHTILLGLTTTPGSDWHEKILEIDRYKLEKIALFPTFLNNAKRLELYGLLEKTGIKTVPHVHLRDDTSKEELKYLKERYQTKLFNIHPSKSARKTLELLLCQNYNVYIENIGEIEDDFEEIVKKSTGLCFDYSHYHDHWTLCQENNYKVFSKIIDKYPIGCGHVSAIKKVKSLEFNGEYRYGRHFLDELSDVDYMANYTDYLPAILSLELENSFKKQLEVKKYLENIINK